MQFDKYAITQLIIKISKYKLTSPKSSVYYHLASSFVYRVLPWIWQLQLQQPICIVSVQLPWLWYKLMTQTNCSCMGEQMQYVDIRVPLVVY